MITIDLAPAWPYGDFPLVLHHSGSGTWHLSGFFFFPILLMSLQIKQDTCNHRALFMFCNM